jgi:hypothetical protein
MKLPTYSVHLAGGDDRGALPGALEFVAPGRLHLAQVFGTVVGQRMPSEAGDEERLLQPSLEHFAEIDDLFLFDAALLQPE